LIVFFGGTMLNWIAAKLQGIPTINETCRDGVVEFLTKQGISRLSFSFLTGERSGSGGRFHQRVYFGGGQRTDKRVWFLLSVDENLPYPYGALVPEVDEQTMRSLHQEWRAVDPIVRFSFFGFALERLGKLEELAPAD
jgi:hypothetical protein